MQVSRKPTLSCNAKVIDEAENSAANSSKPSIPLYKNQSLRSLVRQWLQNVETIARFPGRGKAQNPVSSLAVMVFQSRRTYSRFTKNSHRKVHPNSVNNLGRQIFGLPATGEKRVYTTTMAPFFSRSVARPRGHRAKNSYGVFPCFPVKKGEQGIHHRSGKKGIQHEASDPEKKENFHGGGVYFLPRETKILGLRGMSS